MGSSTHHPLSSKQQGAENSLSLSHQSPSSFGTNSNSNSTSTNTGSHSPSHINFHPPRVTSFAPSTFPTHQNHHYHHPHQHLHQHHPTHSQSPLHDHWDAFESDEYDGTPPLSSLSLTTSNLPYDHPPPPPPPPSAVTPTSSMGNPHPHHPHQHQPPQKDKPQLSIILDAPYLSLKGTGPDVEPTTLSGHVLLHLTESTTLKEITLQFRGKAKIPMPANESLTNTSTSITYVVCNHDWSFLESSSGHGHPSAQGSSSSSSKKHSRTLKAGNHYFPFNLTISGTLPSSLSTSALNGASVVYKLRAVASRPGFAHKLQAIAAVPLIRTFTPEGLEYQQTLEIENTWPDKMMYAIMLPHKAWAAGDVLGAVVKFSPLAKGVRVMSVVSTLWETTKIFARSGTQEETRPVCSSRHEIVEGSAVEVDWGNASGGHSSGGERSKLGFGFVGTGSGTGSGSSRPEGHSDAVPSSSSSSSSTASSTALTEAARRRQEREEDQERERQMGYENNDVVTYITMSIPPSSLFDAAATTPTGGHTPAPSTPGSSSYLSSFSYQNSGANTPNNTSTAPPSSFVTPSHSLEPVIVSHRMRWSIYIGNRDGHVSELRCSLPVVILDGRMKEEARDASMMSRRLMIRSCVGLDELRDGDECVWGINALGQDVHDSVGGVGGLGGEEAVGRAAGDRELPSYNAHVRDRVANMFLPEAVTVRVNNPWINRSGHASPVPVPVLDSPADHHHHTGSGPNTSFAMAPCGRLPGNTMTVGTTTTTGVATPERPRYPNAHVMSHLPHAPSPSGSGATTPLDWVNSELLLSLGDDPLRRFGGGGEGPGPDAAPGTGTFSPLLAGMRTPPSVLQYVAPVPGSRWGSRGGSRAGSRAASPERGGGGVGGDRDRDHQTALHSSGEERDREGRSRPSSPVNVPTTIGYVYEPLPSAPSSGHVSQSESSSHHHDSSYGIRNLHSLFKATMKPFTSLSHKHRHDEKDKDKDYHHHHQREDKHGPSSREGSSGGNSRNSREASPIADAGTTVMPSGASSTHTHDSAGSSSTRHHDSYDASSYTLSEDYPTHTNTEGLTHTSMSTSELTALRRTAISSPYSHVNVHSQRPHQQQQQPPLTGPALLHRALTEVPNYSIASRGFIGGVPPLTSMRGLPSYQEAVAVGSHQSGPGRTSSPLAGDGHNEGGFIPNVTEPAETSPLRSVSSEPDLANHFTLTHTPPHHPATALEEEVDSLAEREGGLGILQRLGGAGAISGLGAGFEHTQDDEEDDEEGVIEMRMRSHTITQNNL